MASYYLDTCIWLNLFKREERNGVAYWKYAIDFLEYTAENNHSVIVSTIVLKELSYKLGSSFEDVRISLKMHGNIIIIKTTNSDYDLARLFETNDSCRLSFYDYLHLAISRRIHAILITRDKKLLEVANIFILAKRPEELFR